MKRLVSTILALSLIFALVGCGNSNDDVSTSSDGSELTTLLYGAPSTATSVTVWYALQQGYFEDYGVDLQITFFNSGTSINDAARAGEIDLYSLGSMMSTTGATTFGSQLLCYLAPDNAAYRVYARNDSEIITSGQGHIEKYPNIYGSADAWKNSTVLWTKGQSGHYTINAILEMLGLTSDDVTSIDMEQNQIPAAFAAGEGDVMVAGIPNWNEFEADPEHYTMVASLDELYPDYDNIATIMACPDALENKQEALKGFAKGVMRAQNEFANDDDLFKEWMYIWQSEYNVDVTEESAANDCAFYKMPTLEWSPQYFEGGEDSICANGFMKIAEFMNSVDQMSDEVFAEYNADDYIADDIILAALDELEAEQS